MRIQYVGIEGGATRLTVEEFLEFSSTVRAVLICEDLLSFYDHRSRPVRTRDALVQLCHTWDAEYEVELDAETAPPPEKSAPPSVDFSDRRRHARHSMVVPVSVTHAVGIDVAYTENISEGGLLFRGTQPYCAGDNVKVQIPVAGVAASVVVRSVTSDDSCLTAVAFLERVHAAA